MQNISRSLFPWSISTADVLSPCSGPLPGPALYAGFPATPPPTTPLSPLPASCSPTGFLLPSSHPWMFAHATPLLEPPLPGRTLHLVHLHSAFLSSAPFPAPDLPRLFRVRFPCSQQSSAAVLCPTDGVNHHFGHQALGSTWTGTMPAMVTVTTPSHKAVPGP